MSMEEITDQEQRRREKLSLLRAAGIDPYPARNQRTHTAKQAIAAFEAGELAADQAVILVGRLVLRRVMGKISFGHIEDSSGRIQVFLRRNDLGEEAYNNLFRKLVDLGDFLQVKGPIFRTKAGEITCNVQEIKLIAKTLHPMPDKWHGVTEDETRFRYRYLDLMTNPDVREIFRIRARVVSGLREYLDNEGFLEVETPILQPIYGGAAAKPFVTHHNQLDQTLYLRISFELYLKRLIVGGFERVYEIGRDFRNEGVSFKHNPEFTQLEFYEAYTDYQGVMRRTEEMVAYVVQKVHGRMRIPYQDGEIDFTPPWPRLPLREAILRASSIDYDQYSEAPALEAIMRERGIEVKPDTPRGKLIDKLLSHYVEPNLIQPTFLVDYPLDISPLAKRSPERVDMVERFEGFAGGMEICNAFSELNDPLDQEERFRMERAMAAAGDEEAHPIDDDFVLALRFGMPPTGGFGMGIDRLTMLLTNQRSIREVILFPHLRQK